ncbi:MAG: aconitate hydratase AcnA [Arenicellales bacterium]|nr:aconitate hydratase AcnA [Arenicellales bacterium]
MMNSFGTASTLEVGAETYHIHDLTRLGAGFDVESLPYALKILLENQLRTEDGINIQAEEIESLASWVPEKSSGDVLFSPARVLLQDFTGVPAVVDLAVMREAMESLGGDVDRINPLSPADLVIDHSVMVDFFGSSNAFEKNTEREYARNGERYEFLRWGQQAFNDFRVVPPSTGIVHQVNIEYLASGVFSTIRDGVNWAYPDTVVGLDSHTTMVNGLGVLGWGVGGIEAEAAMLGQPITMLVPDVVGFQLIGRLPEGATATDLVLTVVEKLRAYGVVGKFVEFFGHGLDYLSLADRATIANMAPEYGATCGLFPIDRETINYLRLTGRSESQVALVEAYTRRQGLFRDSDSVVPRYSATLALDLNTVVPSIAGPKRPQDRIDLSAAKPTIKAARRDLRGEKSVSSKEVVIDGQSVELTDGDVVIAAITSCTNTSNPGVIMAAGLLAKKAVSRGLRAKPWVKTSLAPGSKVVTGYLEEANLLHDLETIGFSIVGYGCTTCIGNSGPLLDVVSQAIDEADLIVSSVLSGNRNFEGRVHPEVRMNFLASPPLVVAYAIAGTTDIDFDAEPLGKDNVGAAVFLRDLWPSQDEVNAAIDQAVTQNLFQSRYSDVLNGDEHWSKVNASQSTLFDWDASSTYVQRPPYFDGMTRIPRDLEPISGARVLAMLGDSITTDHISPAGGIAADSPAADYLKDKGVAQSDFNSYGSRRGNHEVMMRGTFANVRLRNELAAGTEGGWTHHYPSGDTMSIYDAAMRYAQNKTPLMVIGGKEYGSGSSRDWAAKGPYLLGVRTVLVESYERIHRSNLLMMGILPLEFCDGASRLTLGLTGQETYDLHGLERDVDQVTVRVTDDDNQIKEFLATVRIDTPREWDYFLNGGILPYVVRQLLED